MRRLTIILLFSPLILWSFQTHADGAGPEEADEPSPVLSGQLPRELAAAGIVRSAAGARLAGWGVRERKVGLLISVLTVALGGIALYFHGSWRARAKADAERLEQLTKS